MEDLQAHALVRVGVFPIKLDEYSEEHTTISSDCRTIHVRKSIWNGKEQKPKTENAIRSVDVPTTLATYLKSFAGDRSSGFLFQTDSGLPLGQSNILRGSLHDLGVEGFHCFRRFRTSYLRKNRVPWDLEKFWIGQALLSCSEIPSFAVDSSARVQQKSPLQKADKQVLWRTPQ